MTAQDPSLFDLAVIGAGINGAGIARDAAGRGARVALIEKDDIAGATSSSSSKLIHGGIRYLENYEFKLVREALAEREALLSMAPHLIRPMTFVMPHVPSLRPLWMIRIGLFLYDRLGGRRSVPASRTVDLSRGPWSVGLKPEFRKGFIYSDCATDDARLVLANVVDAVERGTVFHPRTEVLDAEPDGGHWALRVKRGDTQSVLRARAIVNAAGPWVQTITDRISSAVTANGIRQVKGSHIVVPRLYEGDHAYILQNEDRRVIFMIPYARHYTAIGTTDVPVDGDPAQVAADDNEIRYLTDIATRFSVYPVNPGDVVHTWSGVRPLFDDGDPNPSKVTRDYVLERINVDDAGPLLSIYGGKLTTYRHLAADVMDKLKDITGGRDWTSTESLPGGDFRWRDRQQTLKAMQSRFDFLDPAVVDALFRRHGTRIDRVLNGVSAVGDLGEHFGDTLYEREARWCIDNEWAETPDDVLWRRTNAGLHLSPEQRAHFAAWFASVTSG